MNEEILSTMNEVSSTELDAGNAVDCTFETSGTGEITNPVVTVNHTYKNDGPTGKAVLKSVGGGVLIGAASGLGCFLTYRVCEYFANKVSEKRRKKVLEKLQEEEGTETE